MKKDTLAAIVSAMGFILLAGILSDAGNHDGISFACGICGLLVLVSTIFVTLNRT